MCLAERRSAEHRLAGRFVKSLRHHPPAHPHREPESATRQVGEACKRGTAGERAGHPRDLRGGPATARLERGPEAGRSARRDRALHPAQRA
jgi:hypothetical protein